MLAAIASVAIHCERLTTAEQQQGCAWAVQELICSRSDVHRIRDDDPALPLFVRPGYSLKDAKIDLAIERAGGCK